ncbi:MAG: Fe-Mn family superoxide dismutase [Cellvibrionaceae bacterium]|jgi:Fe-Mn family superoxide dismutase
MSFSLPPLPYEKNALEPHISSETLDYHYGKHHQTYVTKLNGLVSGSDMEGKSLEEVIKNSDGGMFNNAAQVWNHTFYWNCLSADGGREPQGDLATAINAKWGSYEKFVEEFSNSAINNFGSGWTWLAKSSTGELEIVNTSNAGCPLTMEGVTPILTCDVWEHAYYIDYRNARPKYLEAFWKLVNWDFASAQYA